MAAQKQHQSFLNKKKANLSFEKGPIQRKISPNIFYRVCKYILNLENSLKIKDFLGV